VKKNRYRIIGVDFDGTLAVSKGTYPKITGEITDIINYVLEEQNKGAYLILITMREGKDLERAVRWCKRRGLVFDAVNDNLDFMKKSFHNNPRKIFCTEYIDDMNFGGINYILQEIKRKKEKE
jgi:hydroxymethylpyrimidine pyrophosphatase-like HAD family hydrolase